MDNADHSQLTRWIVTEALSCLVDVAIIAFTVFLIMRLQMKQWMKIKIVSAFGLRFMYATDLQYCGLPTTTDCCVV